MKTEMIITTRDLRGEIHSDARPEGLVYEFHITRRGEHVFGGHGFPDLAVTMIAIQRAMVELLQPELKVAA